MAKLNSAHSLFYYGQKTPTWTPYMQLMEPFIGVLTGYIAEIVRVFQNCTDVRTARVQRTDLKIISETSNFDKMASGCYFFNILYSLCLFPSSTARNKRKTTLRICCRRRKSMVTRKKWQKVITWQSNDVIRRIEPNDCEYIKCLSPEKP